MLKLLIDFRLEAVGEDARILGMHGDLCFNDGDAFREAARWCKHGLHEFLWNAIRDRLQDVQSAMEETNVITPS